MVTISVLGNKLVIVTQPVFGKAGFLRHYPTSADNPSEPQMKARKALAVAAHGLIGTMGSTSKGPEIAMQVKGKVATGKGVHGGMTKEARLAKNRARNANSPYLK